MVKLFCLVNGHDQSEGFTEFVNSFGDGGSPLTPVKGGKNAKQAQEAPVIDEDIWSRFPILDDEWFKVFKEVRGWDPEIIKKLDIRIQGGYRDSKSGEMVWLNPGQAQRVAIPVRDRSGRLRNIRLYRHPGANVQNKIISWGAGYGSARLFPNINQIDRDGPILLLEGEPDTVCGLSFGFNCATLTANNVRKWTGEMLAPFRGRDVIICYDADQHGVAAAKLAAENLIKVATSVRILIWPDFMGRAEDGTWPQSHGDDLTDFFMMHKKTAKDLQDLFATAQAVEKPEKVEAGPNHYQFWAMDKDGKRSTFKPRLLAERLIQDVPLLYSDGTGQLYCWNAQFYELYSEGHLKKRAINYLGRESIQNRVNDAAFQAKILSIVPHGRELNDKVDWLCVKNGMLNVVTGEFKPHAKEYLSTVQLGVEYAPETDMEKDCKLWKQFLEETVKTKEVIMQLQEFAGYCLTREVRYGKCLLLLGPGSDGKSVFLKIIRALVGHDNCAAVQFKDLDDQFQRVAIYNKLLNISTEVGSEALESSMFKAIVTGDPIQASFKHRDVFTFTPYVKLAFAANRLPRVLDNSDGFYRRVLPIQFKEQFLDGDPRQDPHLEDKLMQELSEIFLWALVGLDRLRRQGGFTDCEETRTVLNGFKLQNNPVVAFVDECCVVGEGAEVSKDAIFDSYKKFCREGNYKPLNKANFFRELRSAFNVRDHRPRGDGGTRERMLLGIGLRDGFEELTSE
ncbi:MAG: phage/plasmid primase, P4 family [Pseudodesulfovibrio sp.]|uniref:phage/plasmid primase, P4 family n=1 Tax=Pseudodesulfovibrio sp. TaxID=2035812 RepID=UPI003D0D3748